MADPLSIAGTVAGLVTLVDMVFVRAFRYIREVKSAEKSVNDLVKLLQAMCGTLHMLEQRLRVIDEQQTHQNLRLLPPILQDCTQLLADVDSKLAKYQKHNAATSLNKVASTLRNLQWPFDVSATKQLVKQLTEFNDVLNTTLNANTMLDVHETLEAVGRLGEGMNRLERSLSMKHNQFLAKELNKEQKEAVAYFQNADPAERHKIATKLWERGTGRWFTESEDCVSWLDGRTPRLWLSGIPGAGKTVLASAIIEKARKECMNSIDNTALAYYYCDYKDPATHKIANILGSLAAQIAVHSEEALRFLLDYYQKFCEPGRAPPSEERPELTELIREMAKLFDRVTVIVDGLDECGRNVQDVTTDLNSLALPEPVNVSLLLLSRHEHEIQHVLGDRYMHISIAAQSPDLKLYVCAQMSRRTADGRLIIDDIDVKSKIIEKLVNNADGMFRWVTCQLDYLCDLATDSERVTALDNLPPDLNSSYDRILDRVNQKGASVQKIVQRTLKWVIHSSPRVSISALREALSVDQEQDQFEKGKLPAEAFILRHCSSLVRKSADGNYIEPAHFTVKEYLESIAANSEVYSYYRVDIADTNQYLAMVCTTYLCFHDFGHFETLMDNGQRLEDHPFRMHAVKRWSHYAKDLLENELLMKLIQTLMKPEKTINFLTWLHDHLLTYLLEQNEYRADEWITDLVRSITPLHCAAFLRLPQLILWLANQGMDIDSMSAIGSPVHCAILGSDVFSSATQGPDSFEPFSDIDQEARATIEQLLELKADATRKYLIRSDSMYVSSLYLLLRNWSYESDAYRSCILSLLEAGVKLDALAGRLIPEIHSGHHNERQAIIECFDFEDVEPDFRVEFLNATRLIKDLTLARPHGHRLSNVDSIDMEQKDLQLLPSALRFATRLHHSLKVKELLSTKDIDVNAADDHGNTALHIAADQGDLDVATMLVEHGANVNVTNIKGCTPLHECVYSGHIDIGALLLLNGADTTITNSYGQTIWSMAAACNRVAMLKLPLSVFEGQEEKICEILALREGPLFCAATIEEVVISLATDNRRVNVVNEDGHNLSHCARHFSLKLLRILKERGLNIRHIDNDGRTALHAVAEAYQPQKIPPEIIRFLVAEGCDQGSTSLANGTALHALLLNESFMQDADGDKRNGFIELFMNDLTKSATDSNGMTALDSFIIKAWHKSYFVAGLDFMLSCGAPLVSEKDHFAAILDQLLGPLEKSWAVETILIERASIVLRRLLQLHPNPETIVHSIHGPTAALWAARNSASDLLLALVTQGVSVTRIVKRFNECALRGLVHKYHEETILKTILDRITEADLQVRYQGSFSLLHLLCDNDSLSQASAVPLFIDRGLDVDAVSDHGLTPSMIAAQSGKLDHLRALIGRGANAVKGDLNGWTVLQHACFFGQTRVLDYLISNFGGKLSWDIRVTAEVSLDPSSKWTLGACTVLHLSTKTVDTTRLVLDNHPNLDLSVVTSRLESALHVAALIGTYQTVELLLDRGIGLESRARYEYTALHYAALSSRLDIIRILTLRGANLDAVTDEGRAALHYAAVNGDDQTVRFLIDTGAASTRDAQGLTPELIARSKGHIVVADLLLRHFEDKTEAVEPSSRESISKKKHKVFGAILNAIKVGDHKLIRELVSLDADKECPLCPGCAPVQEAMESEQWEIVDFLMDQGYPTDYVACPLRRSPGHTPLHLAAMLAAPKKTLEALLSRTDQNDLYSQFAIHPLHLAIMTNVPETLKTLLQHYTYGQSKSSFDLNHLIVDEPKITGKLKVNLKKVYGDYFAGSVLHLAAMMNMSDMIKILLEYGADLETTTSGDLLTPLHVAAANGCLEAITLLLDRGARINSGSDRGLTPLFTAVENGNLDAAQLLLQKGASLAIDDVQIGSHSALLVDDRFTHWILREKLSFPVLTEASRSSDKSLWAGSSGRLLLYSIDPIPDSFEIPVDSLSLHIYHEGLSRLRMILRWLDKHNLLPMQLRHRRLSPLCVAAQGGDLKVIEMLLAAGADINDNGCKAGTPLMLACAIGRFEVVKLLVRRGASLTAEASNGEYNHAVDKAKEFGVIKRWLLVDRWTEQRRIASLPHSPEILERGIKNWSGPLQVSAPLPLFYKQYTDESLLTWHVRKRHMLRWFEGRVLHYGPDVKYIFAN